MTGMGFWTELEEFVNFFGLLITVCVWLLQKIFAFPEVAQLKAWGCLICQCGWDRSGLAGTGKRGSKGIKKRRQLIGGSYRVMGLITTYFWKCLPFQSRNVWFLCAEKYPDLTGKHPERSIREDSFSIFPVWFWFQESSPVISISFLLPSPMKITGWLHLSLAFFQFYLLSLSWILDKSSFSWLPFYL